MRKKELIRNIERLINSMNSLQHKLDIEIQENKELRNEIENLKIKLKDEREKNSKQTVVIKAKESVTAEPEGFVINSAIAEEDIQTAKKETFPVITEPVVIAETDVPVETKIETPAESKTVAEKKTENESELLRYGSVAIGTIVQESVKYTASINSSDYENKKELLSLIMGKGEMAKAEIFSIIEGDAADETKRDLIDNTVKETVDYFKSVAGQI